MESVQSKQPIHENEVNEVALVSLLLTLNLFQTIVFTVNFEQVKVCLENMQKYMGRVRNYET